MSLATAERKPKCAARRGRITRRRRNLGAAGRSWAKCGPSARITSQSARALTCGPFLAKVPFRHFWGLALVGPARWTIKPQNLQTVSPADAAVELSDTVGDR